MIQMKKEGRVIIRKYQNLFFPKRIGILFVLFILASGCKKEEVTLNIENPNTETPDTEVEPTQYDVPFNNVPIASDIAMYEVNIRAFSTSGNLNLVQDNLDSIKNLGINIVWLMPIYPTGDLKSVGSPYAVKNYTEVNPDFGTLNDLRSLVKEAHTKNMAVILDWVANHTAWDHPWIQNKSWYTQDASGNIVSPDGWTDVADLNYSSTAMRSEMIRAMKYWVLEANIDGYRCDFAEGVPTDFWKQAIDSLRNIPNRKLIMFAEAGKKELYTAGFDLTFGWDFYNKLNDVFNNNESTSGLVTVNNADYSGIPDGAQVLRWITNHDDNAWEATPLETFGGKNGSLAAFVLTAYMGGVPLIYNGQEVGCPVQLSFFEGSNTVIDWTINPEMKEAYQKIMAFRNQSSAVKTGAIETFYSNDVMAFKRISGDEEVLVVVNLRDHAVNFELPAVLANTSWSDAFSQSSVQLESEITLDSYEYKILKN